MIRSNFNLGLTFWWQPIERTLKKEALPLSLFDCLPYLWSASSFLCLALKFTSLKMWCTMKLSWDNQASGTELLNSWLLFGTQPLLDLVDHILWAILINPLSAYIEKGAFHQFVDYYIFFYLHSGKCWLRTAFINGILPQTISKYSSYHVDCTIHYYCQEGDMNFRKKMPIGM